MLPTALARDAPPRDEPHPPVRIDIFYAMIAFGSMALWSIRSGWLLYFYLPPAGRGTPLVPVAIYGGAIAVARVIDITTGPPIGYWSDHFHSRWGRRLPFIFWAGLPWLVSFVLLWTPPVAGESAWNLIYLAGVLALYNIASNLYQIPYNALLPELALTERHRVRMSAWYAASQLVGVILAGFAGLALDRLGYPATALIYAGAALPFFYLPFIGLRERPGRQIAAAERLDFWKSLSTTLRNRLFRVFILTWALYWITTTFVQAVIPYIATEICRVTRSDTIYFYLPAVLASLACFPAVTWLSGRAGKRRVLAGSLLASAIVLPGLLLIGDWLPVPLLVQGIVWVTLEAIALSGLTVLPPVFIAEITDEDAAATGQRREGSYYSVQGLFGQVANGLAMVVLPLLLLLGRSRSDAHGPLGVQMVGVVGGLMLFAAFLVFRQYSGRRGDPPVKG